MISLAMIHVVKTGRKFHSLFVLKYLNSNIWYLKFQISRPTFHCLSRFREIALVSGPT